MKIFVLRRGGVGSVRSTKLTGSLTQRYMRYESRSEYFIVGGSACNVVVAYCFCGHSRHPLVLEITYVRSRRVYIGQVVVFLEKRTIVIKISIINLMLQ